MPCYDGRTAIENDENRKKVPKLTRLLCLLCRQIEALNNQAETYSQQIPLPEEVQEWWKQHKANDEKRNSSRTVS